MRLKDSQFYSEMSEILSRLKRIEYDPDALVVMIERREYSDIDLNHIIEYEIVFEEAPCTSLVLQKKIYKNGEPVYHGFIRHICGCGE